MRKKIKNSNLLAKEAETLIFLFNHLESEKKIDETNRKLSLALIEPFFKDFSEKLVLIFLTKKNLVFFLSM